MKKEAPINQNKNYKIWNEKMFLGIGALRAAFN